MAVPNASKLRFLRESRGLRRSAVAAEVGISDRTIKDYESGDRSDFSGAKLSLLADYYDVPLSDLIQTKAERDTERAKEEAAAVEARRLADETSTAHVASRATRVARIYGPAEVVNWFADLDAEVRNQLVSQMHHQSATPAEASA